tara:strand:+ start:30 stop:818 length:789 start_codon:yes stop_codon:yes gene_type:complete
MGVAYKVPSNGSDFGNLYGLAYYHPNNGSNGQMAGSHQMVWNHNGKPKSSMGSNIWTIGNVQASGGNSNEWNTAYDWGNHASAGYYSNNSSPNFNQLKTDYAHIYGSTNSSTSTLLRIESSTNFSSAPGKMVDFVESDGKTRGYIGMNQYSVQYNTSSDYRLKRNVTPILNSMDRVKLLKPSRFNWIGGPDDYTVDGFIAHEIAEVIPEAVTGDKDAVTDEGVEIHQAVDQSKITPLLAAALKDAIAKIEELEERMLTMESK